MKKKTIKGDDLLALLMPGQVWDVLFDDDAVRVCLLVIATCVFIGREGRYNIPDHMLTMIEDFSIWNLYPWGEYMWAHLCKRTVNVIKKHNQAETKKAEAKKPVKKSPKKE